MKEKNEQTNPIKVAFFDADKTLWKIISIDTILEYFGIK